MGMDLYKYKITPTSGESEFDSLSVGENLSVAQLSKLSHLTLTHTEEYSSFVESINNTWPDFFIQTPTSDTDRIWDFSLYGDGGFACLFNKKLTKESIKLDKAFSKTIECCGDSDKAIMDLQLFQDKIQKELMKISTFNTPIETEFGQCLRIPHESLKVAVSTNIPYSNLKELGYWRKPFRKESNNCVVNNFGGNDSSIVSTAFDKFCRSLDYSIVVITNQHNTDDVNTLASLMDTDAGKYFLSLFPLLDDEIIRIDW